MEFWYKELVYVDPARGILGGVLLTYEAPTGSPGIAAPGPSYTINPLLNLATNRSRSMRRGASAFPVTNFTSTSPGTRRSWSSRRRPPLWRSPGGTALALVVSHDFTTNATPLLLNTAQLVARQFQIQATYGGVNSTVVDPREPRSQASAAGQEQPIRAR